MSIVRRIAREPNAIAGVIAAVYGLLVAFGVFELSPEQVGGCVALWGAVVALLRWLTTPAKEVRAQQKPGGPVVDPEGNEVYVRPILGKG